jgi:hypothetical protein
MPIGGDHRADHRPATRVLAEGPALGRPATAELAELFGYADAAAMLADVAAWRAEAARTGGARTSPVAYAADRLEERLLVGAVAAEVALALARRSRTALPEGHEAKALKEDFGAVARGVVESAIGDLHARGLVGVDSAPGIPIVRLWPTERLFFAVDGPLHGHDVAADGTVLASLLMGGPSPRGMASLHAETGWDLRRFNPALMHLLRLLPGRHPREEAGPYPVREVAVAPAARARLATLLETARRRAEGR